MEHRARRPRVRGRHREPSAVASASDEPMMPPPGSSRAGTQGAPAPSHTRKSATTLRANTIAHHSRLRAHRQAAMGTLRGRCRSDRGHDATAALRRGLDPQTHGRRTSNAAQCHQHGDDHPWAKVRDSAHPSSGGGLSSSMRRAVGDPALAVIRAHAGILMVSCFGLAGECLHGQSGSSAGVSGGAVVMLTLCIVLV